MDWLRCRHQISGRTITVTRRCLGPFWRQTSQAVQPLGVAIAPFGLHSFRIEALLTDRSGDGWFA